jgi:hypothetical protein
MSWPAPTGHHAIVSVPGTVSDGQTANSGPISGTVHQFPNRLRRNIRDEQAQPFVRSARQRFRPTRFCVAKNALRSQTRTRPTRTQAETSAARLTGSSIDSIELARLLATSRA